MTADEVFTSSGSVRQLLVFPVVRFQKFDGDRVGRITAADIFAEGLGDAFDQAIPVYYGYN